MLDLLFKHAPNFHFFSSEHLPLRARSWPIFLVTELVED